MARVRIVKVPKALSGLEVKMQPGLYGTNGNTQFNRSAHLEAGKISQKPTEVRNTLQPVAREGANLEAEKGETAVVNIDGIPAHFKIGGKRHSQGGTPLNLPDNSFIFSDTAKMRIKDPVFLGRFCLEENGISVQVNENEAFKYVYDFIVEKLQKAKPTRTRGVSLDLAIEIHTLLNPLRK